MRGHATEQIHGNGQYSTGFSLLSRPMVAECEDARVQVWVLVLWWGMLSDTRLELGVAVKQLLAAGVSRVLCASLLEAQVLVAHLMGNPSQHVVPGAGGLTRSRHYKHELR